MWLFSETLQLLDDAAFGPVAPVQERRNYRNSQISVPKKWPALEIPMEIGRTDLVLVNEIAHPKGARDRR